MSTLTDALVREHEDLGGRIEDLRRLADDIDDERLGAVIGEVDESLAFLERDLLAHADAEDVVLYPAVAAALGSPEATATMSRDHVEIRRLVAELRRHRDELLSGVVAVGAHEVRRVLYGLYAILTLHVAKEEELYVPVLDRSLTEDRATELLEQMHRAAHVVT